MGKNRTKKRLAAALELCLREKPLDRIRIHEVTDLCDLNRQSFYYHFEDIYDLYIWTYRQKLDRLMAVPAAGTWRQGAAAVAKHAAKNRNFYCPLRSQRCARDFQAYLEEKASAYLAAQPQTEQEQMLSDGYDRQFLARYFAIVFLLAAES